MEPEESVVSPSVVSSIGGGFAILSGYAFIGLSFLIVAEVAARKLFGVSFQSVDEISGYVVAVVSPFAFAYALMMAAHTRIDIFYGRFRGRSKQVLDVAACLVLAGVAAFMTRSVWQVLLISWKFGTVSIGILSIPLWIPQSLWFLGSIVFLAVAVVQLAMAARGIGTAPDGDNDPNATPNGTL
ncbi:MAG: TRAP transporter small permease [Hyphomicrobiales bacterium]|nr:TRAP transporter small permease [Nitratireductor sp.]MCC2098810.1 TRAP transporter small permease [Hyphomicrobiales bacterium]